MAKIVFIDEGIEIGAHIDALKRAGYKVIHVDPTVGKRMERTRQALRRGSDLIILEPINYIQEELPELNRLLDGRTVLVLASSPWTEISYTHARLKPMLPSELVTLVNRLLRI